MSRVRSRGNGIRRRHDGRWFKPGLAPNEIIYLSPDEEEPGGFAIHMWSHRVGKIERVWGTGTFTRYTMAAWILMMLGSLGARANVRALPDTPEAKSDQEPPEQHDRSGDGEL